MLDDLDKIRELDKGDALGVVAGQPAQLGRRFSLDVGGIQRPDNLVLAGMGGSALAAEFLRAWLGDRLPVPFTIVRDYNLPAFVGPKTLVVISSYSGNTEETLAALERAKMRGAQIVVMSSGGRLAGEARAENYPLLELPSGLQPRLAVLYGVKALATMLDGIGLERGLAGELEEAGEWLEHKIKSWLPEAQTGRNPAKALAKDLAGYPAVIYGGPTLWMAALKWKIDLNENAKNVAFYYAWPEFDHNEFTGWFNPRPQHFKVVELLSSLDEPEIKQRFKISDKLLEGTMPEPIQIEALGGTKLKQMLWAILLGDFVSVYLALLNGVDPTPVDLVEELKRQLAG